jgi:NAD(P)H dehydrogenase (quinone)
MARILIVYDSRTGNTEKMALAVAEGVRRVKDVEVTLRRSVKQVFKTCVLPMGS